ncbi:MAG: SRPBCC family protein [Desulfobacterales bacterium]|jgi:ligand-binding SRPBCC domain-containing protein
MHLYRLTRSQHLPIGVDHAWAFFADPRNLPRITPGWLRFRLTAPPGGPMHPGMILTYHLTPFWRLPCRWVSEITHVCAPRLFVDEQRLGPYRLWHHLHRFEEAAGGVTMHDVVHYALPYGHLGRLLHRALLHNRLQAIFDFRRERLTEIFAGPAT